MERFTKPGICNIVVCEKLCRFAIYWPILFKLNYFVRTAIANNTCKFHEDRLNDGVTIYFIVAKPRGISGTLSHVFATDALSMRFECDAPYYCRTACVWTAVRSVYGQPKKQKRKYISGIAAMTAGQILVIYHVARIAKSGR